MSGSAEAPTDRKSRRSPRMTMNVVVDVHNADGRCWRRGVADRTAALTAANEKERSDGSRGSSRASKNRSNDRRSKGGSSVDRSRDQPTAESLDLIEEFQSSDKDRSLREEDESELLLDEKPRRRKQWRTVNAENGGDDPKKPARKRWSKDTSVFRLPESSDASPTLECRGPVPAPRSNATGHAPFYDNPTFVTEYEEILRVETDHKRDSTKIEIRRMSDRSSSNNTVDGSERSGGTDTSSGVTSRKETKEPRSVDGDRSAKPKFSVVTEATKASGIDSCTSFERYGSVDPSSVTSDEPSARLKLPATRDEYSLKKRERSLSKRDLADEASSRDANSTSETKAETTVRKRRRKKKKQEKAIKEETMYISVTVHRADVLEANYASIKRPMVKVHIVHARTGDYLTSTRDEGQGSVRLQPMITGKFDFRENRSLLPVWEEELIFEHSFAAVTNREDDQVVILFEVIDLLSFAEASNSYDKFGNEGCWNKIAWAFLKPVGANNTLHTDKKVRLQLYKPKRSLKRTSRSKCEVYSWWQSNNRDKYPSSLFVTVTSIAPPKLEPVFYQQLELNELSDTRNDSQEVSTRTSDSISLPKWARLAAQSCKIPNERMFETEASENGYFYVAFNNDGKYLACVHSEEYDYPIVIYELATGKIHVRFLGHKTFVYSLNWSHDDHHLLSASADQTARIWDVRNKIVQDIELLPHPAYVYCATYGWNDAKVVATGCYDRIARVWTNDKRSKRWELSQELEGHEGFVNCIVSQKNGDLITADSAGTIILWAARRNGRALPRKEWCLARRIRIKELEGIVINTILLHPLGSRLLVHSRNNGLRMLDLATGVVLRKYNQLNNQRIQSRACISPCGGLVLCGGEDSVLNVWNLETGKHIARYANERCCRAVTCVDYHPYDHVLAFSTFGSPAPVRVLKYNKDANGSDVNLRLTEHVPATRANEVAVSVLNYPVASRIRSNSGGRNDSAPSRNDERVLPLYRLPNRRETAVAADDSRERTTRLRRSSEARVKNARSKSSNRLYCIIEKIDRILWNASKSSDDVESGRCADFALNASDSNGSRRASRGKENKRIDSIRFSSVNERTSPSAESSSASADLFKLDAFPGTKRYHLGTKGRPKSAKEPRMDRMADQDRSKSLSDGAANPARFYDRHRHSIEGAKGNLAESSFTVPSERKGGGSSDTTDSAASFEKVEVAAVTRSPPGSADTYVVETTDRVEKFVDSYNESAASEECKRTDGIQRRSDRSDCSVISSATFVVQNDAPVPKPRRRKS